MKNLILNGLLLLALVGFAYGAFHHSRFIGAGGQRGAVIQRKDEMSSLARAVFARMKIGYLVFCISLALALAVSAIWGAARA